MRRLLRPEEPEVIGAMSTASEDRFWRSLDIRFDTKPLEDMDDPATGRGREGQKDLETGDGEGGRRKDGGQSREA